MHQFPDLTPFEKKMQAAEFSFLRGSEMRKVIAENYIGLPY
jgi:p-hydroxybenzoate 3-monooxygenase